MRAYTLDEIDALRTACFRRFWSHPSMRSYRPGEVQRMVEDTVRTYMLGGVTADAITEAMQKEEAARVARMTP